MVLPPINLAFRFLLNATLLFYRDIEANKPENAYKYVVLEEAGNELLKNIIDRLGLSVHGYDCILKVSRTMVDLENEENV